MKSANFSIGEWLVCSKCGVTCDALFRPESSDATEPELFLGQSLPEFNAFPEGEWTIGVSACCPGCSNRINAMATFQSRTLRDFQIIDTNT